MTNDQPPIAYEVVSERGREAVYAADLREHAERACILNGWRLVPIYPVTKPLPGRDTADVSSQPLGGAGTGPIIRRADPRREVF